MYRILTTFVFVFFVSFGLAAQTSLEDYKAKHEGWFVNIDKAYEESQKTGKPIMANFTGSDWCPWCVRLSQSVFVHDSFMEWANKNVVLLELDFPRRSSVPKQIKEQNNNLQRAFGVRGFPSVWLFDLDKSNGQFNVVAHGKTGYAKDVATFTSTVDQILEKREKS